MLKGFHQPDVVGVFLNPFVDGQDMQAGPTLSSSNVITLSANMFNKIISDIHADWLIVNVKPSTEHVPSRSPHLSCLLCSNTRCRVLELWPSYSFPFCFSLFRGCHSKSSSPISLSSLNLLLQLELSSSLPHHIHNASLWSASYRAAPFPASFQRCIHVPVLRVAKASQSGLSSQCFLNFHSMLSR